MNTIKYAGVKRSNSDDLDNNYKRKKIDEDNTYVIIFKILSKKYNYYY